MNIPDWIIDVFYTYLTSELIYMCGEYPITTPVTTFYDENRNSIIVSTSVALYNKVRCIKRSPKISILYSRPGYDKQDLKPVVLVQGDAVIHDRDFNGNSDYLSDLMRRQRDSWKKSVYDKMGKDLNEFMGKLLMDWYMIRVIVEIKPRRVIAWKGRDLDEKPMIVEEGK